MASFTRLQPTTARTRLSASTAGIRRGGTIRLVALAAAIGLILTGCLSKPPREGGAGPSAQGGTVQIKGSDTMVNLGQAWAEAFMKANPGTSVAVTGGGSGTGIAALINKTTAIAQSSRKMKPDEFDKARQNGLDPKEFLAGSDGLAVIVHPSNPLSQIDFTGLKRIFTGQVSNWKELGGPDRPIVVMSREVNSGTHIYFKEEVLKDAEFSPKALLMPSSQAIVDGVAQDQGAVGYLGMAYVSDRVKALKVSKDGQTPAVEPIEANVLNGKYPISRPLYLYTATEPAGAVRRFLDFALGPEGQRIVEQVGFTPIKK